MPKKPEAGEKLTPKAFQLLQATMSTTPGYPGQKGIRLPIRKMSTTVMPATEKKTPETKEKEETVQPKDSHRAKRVLCSSDFCNGRGICMMEGKLRKCSCLMEYGGEFCEEAMHGFTPGYIVLGVTIVFSVVLVSLGALVYFRREHELKR